MGVVLVGLKVNREVNETRGDGKEGVRVIA